VQKHIAGNQMTSMIVLFSVHFCLLQLHSAYNYHCACSLREFICVLFCYATQCPQSAPRVAASSFLSLETILEVPRRLLSIMMSCILNLFGKFGIG